MIKKHYKKIILGIIILFFIYLLKELWNYKYKVDCLEQSIRFATASETLSEEPLGNKELYNIYLKCKWTHKFPIKNVD